MVTPSGTILEQFLISAYYELNRSMWRWRRTGDKMNGFWNVTAMAGRFKLYEYKHDFAYQTMRVGTSLFLKFSFPPCWVRYLGVQIRSVISQELFPNFDARLVYHGVVVSASKSHSSSVLSEIGDSLQWC
jgi:hypothetical protein